MLLLRVSLSWVSRPYRLPTLHQNHIAREMLPVYPSTSYSVPE